MMGAPGDPLEEYGRSGEAKVERCVVDPKPRGAPPGVGDDDRTLRLAVGREGEDVGRGGAHLSVMGDTELGARGRADRVRSWLPGLLVIL